MSANNYLFDTRDTKFILKEWLDMEKLFSQPAYRDYYSVDDIDSYIDVAYKIARDVFAPANDDADKIGVKFENGKVITPDSFKNAFKTVNEAGLGPSVADREVEGHLPWPMWGGLGEMLIAGSAAVCTYFGLTCGAAQLIQTFATPELKERFLPKMFDGTWAGTMNLTEAGAGSDVGAVVTKAYPTDTPGLYKIKGNKQFITAADHDMCENFIHMVLARIEGAREGTAGISLFIVPKIWVNEDGSLGEWNDVTTVGIEHKMGLKGSATCTLAFGENDKCFGYIVGNPPGEDGKGEGMAQMFKMMNEERLNTGLLAQGVTTEAYFNSLAYARERIQSTKLTDMKGPRVRIIEHEDVRRMLMYQKAVTEAGRALLMKTYWYVDMAAEEQDPELKHYYHNMFMLNNPLCKAYVSDVAWPSIGEAIQTYGGYGYIEEYPVAQLARDVKIFSIWEGTNYIQALDLVARKYTMEKGKPFMKWMTEIYEFIAANKGNETFTKEFAMLEQCFGDFGAMMKQLQTYLGQGKIGMMGLWATRFLHTAAMVYCSMLLLDQALLAERKLKELGEDHYDAKFYKGKIATARFYTLNILPQVKGLKEMFEIGDTSALDIADESFGLA